ncbi:MAG: hypothetical protein WCK90_00115 [archaeon]
MAKERIITPSFGIFLNNLNTVDGDDVPTCLSQNQQLLDAFQESNFTFDVKEFYNDTCTLRHDGMQLKGSDQDRQKFLEHVEHDMYLVQGSGLEASTLEITKKLAHAAERQGRKILLVQVANCSSISIEKYDSGESWMEQELAAPEMPVWDLYDKFFKTLGPDYQTRVVLAGQHLKFDEPCPYAIRYDNHLQFMEDCPRLVKNYYKLIQTHPQLVRARRELLGANQSAWESG